MVFPCGSSFQLFVGGEEALGRAAAVCSPPRANTHMHSTAIKKDTANFDKRMLSTTCGL